MRFMLSIITLLFCNVLCAKPLSVAVTPFAPPFVMATGLKEHFIGFSMEIIQEVCKKMNVECRYQGMRFDESLRAAMFGEVDLAIGNITILPERKKYMLFSVPYLPSSLRFIALSSSKIKTITDIRNKIVGNEIGDDTPSEIYLQEKFGNSITQKKFRFYTDMFVALASKKIDIALMDSLITEVWYANSGKTFKLIGPPIVTGFGYGIVTAKTNTALMKKVNTSLIAMQKDGSYARIYNTYFGD